MGLVALVGVALVPVPAFAAVQGRVVVVGVPGLEWSDIDESGTPHLWELAGRGGTASLSTRAVPPPDRGITCPVAGWLTVSAGQRAGTPGPGCPGIPAGLESAGDGGPVTVSGWADLVAHQTKTGYDARLGTLAQTVADAGGRVAAVGPGAALAAADRTGRVAAYAGTPAGLGDLSSYALIVMDVPDLATAWAAQPLGGDGVPTAMPPDARSRAATAADRQIGEFLAALPPDTTVLVAGISDVTPGAHLHVAIAAGGPFPAGHLTARSTRQEALVAIQDLTATAIHLTGLEPPRQVVGRPWQPGGPAAPTTGETVADLADADLASQVLREVRGPFFAVFVTVQLLFYAFAALALRRRRSPTRHPNAPLPTDTRQAETDEAPVGGDEAARHPEAGDAGSHAGAEPEKAARHPESGARRTVAASGADANDRTSSTASIPTDEPPSASTTDASPRTSGTDDASPRTGGTDDASSRSGANGGSLRTGGTDDVSPRMGAHGGSSSMWSGEHGSMGPAGGLDLAAASRLLVTVQVVSVMSGAIAVATFLAQLVPWWSLPAPMAALIVTIVGMAGLITGLAFAGPWRSHVLGPLTVVALITSVAMLADVMTGSHLQVNAVSGYEPVTGGRFYGFSNIAFAIYATGTILGLAGVAQWLRGRGAPRPAVLAVCVLYGGLAVFADGAPAWGADFGGVPAFVAGLSVFLILLAGSRVSFGKLVVVGLAGAALIGAISFADWLRPAGERTHLGTFVQQIIDGQAWTVVGRKFAAMVGVTVGNWSLTLLSLVALAFLFLVLARPSRWGASALGQAYALAPALRAGLFGALTCAFIGFLMNDSGIAIPAMALTVAVPLTLASCVRALQLATPTTAGRPSAPAAATGRPDPS